MCVVSSLGDDYARQFPQRWPDVVLYPPTDIPSGAPQISKEDFDSLKKEVKELKKLLKAAKRFDEATGQSDCEVDEKVEFLRKVAELVGVDLDEIFSR